MSGTVFWAGLTLNSGQNRSSLDEKLGQYMPELVGRRRLSLASHCELAVLRLKPSRGLGMRPLDELELSFEARLSVLENV